MVYTKAANAVLAWPGGGLPDAVHRAASSQYHLPLRDRQEQGAAQPPTLHQEHADLPPSVGGPLHAQSPQGARHPTHNHHLSQHLHPPPPPPVPL